jgi:long-chain acyl-CoA synthetase
MVWRCIILAEFGVKWAMGKGLLPSGTPIPEPTAPGKPPCADIIKLSLNAEYQLAMMEDLKKFGINAKVRGFEMIKGIFVEPLPFSVETGLLTPTFKLKRIEVLAKYRKRIDDMYSVIAKVPSSSKL